MNIIWKKCPLCVLLIILAGLVQCTFKDPEAPSWDVNFVVPLMNKTYTMQDWIDDEDDLILDQNQNVYYHLEQDLDTLGIEDFLTLNDVNSTVKVVPFPQQADTVQEIVLNESIVVDTAVFKNGTMGLIIENHTDWQLEVDIALPFLTLKDQMEPVIFNNLQLDPGERRILYDYTDLAGAILDPPIEGGKNVIQYTIQVKNLSGNIPTQRTDVDIQLNMENMVLQRLRGWLYGLDMPVDAVQDTLDLPEELEGMMIGQVNAVLQMYSTFDNMTVDMDMKFRGVREDGDKDSVTFQLDDLPPNRWTDVPIEGLENVFNLYPDYYEMTGDFIVGDEYDPDNPTDPVDVSFDDYLFGKALIDIPLVFQFPEDMKNEVEVDTLDLYDEEADEDDTQLNEIFRDNVNSAGIVVEAENHFPLGAKVTIIFSKMRGDSTIYTMTHPTDVVKVLDLKPGTLGGGDGTKEDPAKVIAPSTNLISLTLSEDEVSLFESREVYMGIRFELYPTTQNQELAMVMVLPTDYITLKARVEASLNTKIPDNDKDDEGGAK